MTIAVDLGRKATKHTNKHKNILYVLNLYTYILAEYIKQDAMLFDFRIS